MQPGAIWLVTFFVPWDEHIQSFAPKLEMSFADLTSKGFNVRFGSVDVSVNKQLGWEYQIDRSPVVKLFSYADGEWTNSEYTGQREPMPVCMYCIDHIRESNEPYSRLPEGYTDGDVVEINDDNFDDIVLGSNQVWHIAFSAPWCYHCKLMLPAFQGASQHLGGKVRFAEINADKNRNLARRFNI